jgi:hypothetical protein
MRILAKQVKFLPPLGGVLVLSPWLSGCGAPAVATPAPAPQRGAAARILFQSKRDGNWEIYSMNADGTGQTRLTDDPAGDGAPDW